MGGNAKFKAAAKPAPALSDNDTPGPQLGGLTALAILALLVLQLGIARDLQPDVSSYLTQLWLALVWAGWGVSVWTIVRQPLRMGRVFLLGASLGWHCIVLGVVMERPAERYLVMLGSYGLLQATAALLLNLPEWSRPSRGNTPLAARPKRQFGILGVVILTTGVAIVLFAARRYAALGEDEFLSGAVSVTGLLCVIAIAAMQFSYHRWGRWVGIPALLLMSGLVALAMALLEKAPSDLLVFRDLVWIYGAIISQFGIAIFLVGVCGYLDTLPDRHEETV